MARSENQRVDDAAAPPRARRWFMIGCLIALALATSIKRRND
jgi:hypothetical protein